MDWLSFLGGLIVGGAAGTLGLYKYLTSKYKFVPPDCEKCWDRGTYQCFSGSHPDYGNRYDTVRCNCEAGQKLAEQGVPKREFAPDWFGSKRLQSYAVCERNCKCNRG